MSEWDDDFDTTARISRRRSLRPRRSPTPYPNLTVVAGEARGQSHLVPARGFVVGRSSEVANLAIEDEGISREHARFEREGNLVFLNDLGSTNGVLVNGERVDRCRLEDGDHMSMGVTTVVRFAYLNEQEFNQRRRRDEGGRDRLTGALSEQRFDQLLRVYLARAVLQERTIALLMLDLDRFAQLNEHLGRGVGDLALIEVVNIIQERVTPDELVGRVGGEEFGIVLIDRPHTQVVQLAEDIRGAIVEHRFEHAGKSHSLTASMGLAEAGTEAFNRADALTSETLRRLDMAKRLGRNRVVSGD